MNNFRINLLAIALLICLFSVLMFNSSQIITTRFSDPKLYSEDSTISLCIVHWINIPDDVIKQFEIEYPQIKVNYIQYNPATYTSAIRAELLSIQGIDILGVPQADFESLAQRGYLLALDENQSLANINKDVRSALRLRTGDLYAVALSSTYYGMWYNQSLFEKYHVSPPSDYDDFITLCEMFSLNDIVPIIMGGLDDDSAAMLYPLAGASFAENEETSLADLEAAEVFVAKGYIDKNTKNLTYQQAFSQFKKGRAAMMPAPDYSINMCGLDMDNVFVPGTFAIPDKNGPKALVIPADNLTAIYSGSRHPMQAEQLLKYMSRPDMAKILADTNGWTSSTSFNSNYSIEYWELWESVRNSASSDVTWWVQNRTRQSQLTFHAKILLANTENIL